MKQELSTLLLQGAGDRNWMPSKKSQARTSPSSGRAAKMKKAVCTELMINLNLLTSPSDDSILSLIHI